MNRHCLARLLRNLGYDQVWQYIYPGGFNDFSFSARFDQRLSMGEFKDTLRQVYICPKPRTAEPRTGPFTAIAHDARYGSIGKKAQKAAYATMRKTIALRSDDRGFIECVDDILLSVPISWYHMVLVALFSTVKDIGVLLRFAKVCFDPMIRHIRRTVRTMPSR